MAGANRTTQEDLLRIRYQPRLRVQFNLKSILLQYLRRNSVDYAEGKTINLTLHKGQGGGIRYSSAGLLPPAGHQKPKNATFNYKRMYGRIEIDGAHVEGADDVPAAAIARPYELEVNSFVKQARHHLNYDLFGDGSGLIADITSAASATTVVVESVRGLVDGMYVDVLLKANGAVGGGVVTAEISVNKATKTITFTSPSQFADGTGAAVNAAPTTYAVYRAGSYMDCFYGLDAIINTANPAAALGNYGGIDRTVAGNEFWQGNLFENGGVPRECTFELIEEAIDFVDEHSNGETNLIICGYGVYRKLMAELIAARRVANDTKILNGWAKAIMHNDVPIVRDKHCKPDRMYGLDLSHWELFQNDEGKWMDKDGAVLSRVPGKHAYEAGWFRFMQPVCDAPNTQWVLDDLEVPIAA